MNWPIVDIKEVAEVVSGFGFPRDFQGITNGEYPFFKVGDMNFPGNEVEMRETTNTVSEEILKQLGAKKFPPGTVIFPKIGAAIATGKKRILIKPSTFDNNIMGLVPKVSINPRFLYYWTLTFDFQSIANIGPVPSLRKSTVEQLQILRPAPSEQRRIVEILDQAAALRRKRAEADAKGDRILPTIFIKMFGAPSTWTYSTNTKPLGSIVNIQSGGTPSKQNSDYWNGKIPWVSAKDMKQDIILGSIDHISELAIKETNIKYVEPGAILVLVRGMTLAHTIPIALADCRLTINQDMKALQPNCKDIDSTYLHAALKASSRRLLSQVGTAAHGTRKIDTDELLKLPILIPAKKKLDKFRQNVTEGRMILSGINQTKEKIEKLFEILLNRAFSGELTAKWREAHMKELLAEMEEQVKAFQATASRDYEQLTLR